METQPERSLNDRYRLAVTNFDEALVEASNISRATAGRYVDVRRGWASILFTRLCANAVSLLASAPRSRFTNSHPFEHWDFSAVASLIRNLVECHFIFFYLVVDPADDDDWLFRLHLLQLHDCTSRIRLFRDLGLSEQLTKFEADASELRAKLNADRVFAALSIRERSLLLKGERLYHIPRSELLTRMNEDPVRFRASYRFLSAHVHSGPLAFYRMAEEDRGRGTENRVEKGYIATYLLFAERFLRRASRAMIWFFPDAFDLLKETHVNMLQ